MKVYTISGLGANETVFEKIKLPDGYEFVHLPWIIPNKNESLESYANRISEKIDESEKFILMGLSFGGIMVQEVSKLKEPVQLILISTIKNENEKPLWISINNFIPLYRIFPNVLLTSSHIIGVVSKLRKILGSKQPDLNRIYTFRDKEYINWAFRKIIQWKNSDFNHSKTLHLHGSRDLVFPYRKIKQAKIIQKGSHMMIYEKAEEINPLLF